MIRGLKKILNIAYQLRAVGYCIAAISLMTVILTNCCGQKSDALTRVSLPLVKEVPAEGWQRLAKSTIYFAHQSVGNNIIKGIEEVMKENTLIKLNMVETKKPADFKVPVFGHSRIDRKVDFKSKLAKFVNMMEQGAGDNVHIAFFNFCFLDIVADSDVDRLFEAYRTELAKLKARYPHAVLVHFTVPLTAPQTGPRAWIKKIMGRPIEGHDANMRREEFNAMLRKEYGGKEPIFDLAMVESTLPDGSRAVFEKDGKMYPCLLSEYDKCDRGHLNELGSRKVAEQLLILLANIAKNIDHPVSAPGVF